MPASTSSLIRDALPRDALPELATLGLWRCAPDGRIVHAEGALFEGELLGPDTVLGSRLWELPATSVPSQDADRLRAALSENSPFRDIRLRLEDGRGHSRRLLMGGDPGGGTPDPRGYQGWIRDVTELHRVNEANQNLAHALRHPESAFAIFDASAGLRSHTPQWLDLQGRAVRERVTPGMGFEELLEYELATHPFRTLDQSRRKAWRSTRLAFFQAADGRPLEFRSGNRRKHAIHCLRLADGGTLMSITDISIADGIERAQSEAERFRSYLASSNEWFWEVDERLRLRHISDRLLDDLRLRPSEMLGHPLAELVRQWAVDGNELKRFSAALAAGRAFEGIELSLKDRTSRRRYISVSGVPFTDAKGRFAGVRGIGRDVTQARRMQERLAHRSTHDELTGLCNRLGLQQSLEKLLGKNDPDSCGHALCYLDVDQFQVINDTCGYSAGDALLQRIAAVLEEEMGARSLVARIGGDEFAIALPEHDREAAISVASRLCSIIRDQVFTWDEQPFRVTCSIGLAHSHSVPASATELLRAADSACYAAKDSGRDRVKMFSADDSTLNLRQGRMHWIARINSALQEDRLELYAQPIATTSGETSDYLHYEVLLRLHLRDGRTVSPGEFLPAAEQYNLVTAIDRWVVERCIGFLNDHPLFLDHLSILSVNLSGRSMGDKGFRRWCTELIGANTKLAGKLCFELTETAVMGKLLEGQRFIKRMRDLGCSFALDDFGAGLSSYAYLKDLDVDYIKIDGQFVKDLDQDLVHRAMVRSINEVAHLMGKKTIAEFVENDEIRGRLVEIGVDLVQGYGIGKPVPIVELV